MLKGFLDGIPQSLEDAAMIDGCTRCGRLHPRDPAAQPAGPDLGLRAQRHPRLVAVHHPVHSAQQAGLLPIAVGIFNFQGTYNQTSTQFLAAASVVSIVPAIVVFLVLQRFIVGALMAGAVKG